MHTVFQVMGIKQPVDNVRLHGVQFVMTGENDPQMITLNNNIKKDTRGGQSGIEWVTSIKQKNFKINYSTMLRVMEIDYLFITYSPLFEETRGISRISIISTEIP